MSTLLIRDLKDSVREIILRRAARNGRSMEEEAKFILEQAAPPPLKRQDVYGAARELVAKYGPIDDLVLPPREMPREPPDFT